LTIRAVLPHLVRADSQERVDVIAVCDINGDRARSVSERFRVPRWYADYDRLLRDDQVECVLLLTPIDCHARQAVAALERNLHVYLQKPIGVNVAEADLVLEASEKSAGGLLVAPVQRLCPLVEQMRGVLASGGIGSVYWALTATHFPTTYEGSGFDRSWHLRAAAGPLRDRTIYCLTTLTSLFGPAERVTALSGLRTPFRALDGEAVSAQIDDNTVLLLGFPGGMQAVATGNYCRQGRLVPAGFVGIYGSVGTLETTEVDPDTWYPARVEVWTGGSKADSRALACPRGEVPLIGPAHAQLPEAHVYADVMCLVTAIQNATPLPPSALQARHVVEIIEKAYLAARAGQMQALTTRFDGPEHTEATGDCR
jgi:predicted dehydrogenase